MKRLVLVALSLFLLAAPVCASQEPPPVSLRHSVQGAVQLGRPFVIGLAVKNELEHLTGGRLSVEAGAGLAVGAAPERVGLAKGATAQLAVPVTARSAGVHELAFSWTAADGGPTLATLRLFVHVDQAGGRVLTIDDHIAREAIGETTGPDGAPRRVFPLKRLGRDEPASGITGSLMFKPYAGGSAPARRVKAELYGDVNGRRTLIATTAVDAEGRFAFALPAPVAGRKLVPVFSLATPRWTIKAGSKVYSWEGPALDNPLAGVDVGTLVFPEGQAAAEAMWIHAELNRAQDLYEGFGIDTAWWTSIPVVYPGSADFFSWGTVNLTKAQQWDVTGHEFGHAIFAYGSSAQGSGGQHKIDECYSKGLAWSEGWASWFACAIHEPRNAEDAKFEFMVPRRAPIRIENVPADVCQGDTNEWRVAAALWDVHDTHFDGGEDCQVDFVTMWAAMRAGNNVREVKKYLAVLRGMLSAEDAAKMDAAAAANSVTK